ncbi:MAG: hypothetical protein ABIU06_18200 [Anaerolineales bacterium]
MPTGSGQLPDPQVQGTPTMTMVEPSAETQSTDPEPQIAQAVPQFEVRLSVIRSNARVFRAGSIADIQQAQSNNIQVDDGIQVVKLDGQKQQSYSILDFADDLEVELFSNTSVFLKDLRQDAGGATQVTLHLDRGNIFVHSDEQTTTRVTVQTIYTTIKTLTGGAEFDVCHNEELTCVLVKTGVVEVTARGRKIIIKAGEAGYVLKDGSPSPTICAPTALFIAWEGRYRGSANTPALATKILELPHEPCPVTTLRLPINARILYRDEFRNPSSRWARGMIDNFIASYVRFSGHRYYQVQAQDPEDQYLASVPNERKYEDVNIDMRAMAEAASSGDFRYGTVFRRSGDQYYAFIISPVTKTWSFLKSSSTGLETLREGTDERMRGLEARDTLRVETYGSTFLLYINGRFMDLVSDPDYATGEVGLFAETLDNPDALIRFDSIIIWNVPPVTLIPATGGREYCFNVSDDDGDRLIDRADPDCQRLDRAATPLPLPTNTLKPTRTPKPTRTSTSQPTNTSTPPKTLTPRPTNTRRPTNTFTPRPTRTLLPPKTSTPQPTRTPIPQPTRTPIPQPTRTPVPQPTRTPVPQPTRTPIPQPTRTPIPQPTRTPIPQPTRTPIPQPTRTPIPEPTRTPIPQPTNPPPTNPPPTDPPPTDPPPTDPPPTDPPPTDPPPTDPPPTDPPPTDPPPTDPPTP